MTYPRDTRIVSSRQIDDSIFRQCNFKVYIRDTIRLGGEINGNNRIFKRNDIRDERMDENSKIGCKKKFLIQSQ